MCRQVYLRVMKTAASLLEGGGGLSSYAASAPLSPRTILAKDCKSCLKMKLAPAACETAGEGRMSVHESQRTDVVEE